MATKSKFMPSTLYFKGWVLFYFVVGINLTVERDWPCEEVDPANNIDDCLLGWVDLS